MPKSCNSIQVRWWSVLLVFWILLTPHCFASTWRLQNDRVTRDWILGNGLRNKASRAHSSSAQTTALAIPRGGFNVATTTATATSAFLGLNGAFLIVSPNAVLRQVYKLAPSSEPDDAKLSAILMRSIGCVSIGVALTVYLSIVLQETLPFAVAIGLIPRLLFFFWLLAFYQRTPFLVINTIMGCWCTFSLLKGLDVAPKTWKIFSTVSMFKGLFLVFSPRNALQKFLGVTKFGNKPQALGKALGNEVATSALLMGSLAMGVAPTRAAGYTCLLWILLLADMAWRDKTWKLMDDGPRTQYIHMTISALFATGFLLA